MSLIFNMPKEEYILWRNSGLVREFEQFKAHTRVKSIEVSSDWTCKPVQCRVMFTRNNRPFEFELNGVYAVDKAHIIRPMNLSNTFTTIRNLSNMLNVFTDSTLHVADVIEYLCAYPDDYGVRILKQWYPSYGELSIADDDTIYNVSEINYSESSGEYPVEYNMPKGCKFIELISDNSSDITITVGQLIEFLEDVGFNDNVPIMARLLEFDDDPEGPYISGVHSIDTDSKHPNTVFLIFA